MSSAGPAAAAPAGAAAGAGQAQRAKLDYTPLAAAFCPAEFTIAQLRHVYEAVWGISLDPRNFHRKATGTPGFLTRTGAVTAGGRGRPTQLYRKGPATVLYPPLLRTGAG